jgi:hypothetical protein
VPVDFCAFIRRLDDSIRSGGEGEYDPTLLRETQPF